MRQSWFQIAARYGVGLALFVAGAGCRTTAPSNDVPYSQTDLVVGTGAAVALEQSMTVDYTGYMYDPNKPDGRGPVFDTTTGGTPFTVVLNKTNVIEGWVVGVPGMKIGGTRHLVLPPSLAYGTGGVPGRLPPNATLVFDITLISIQ